MMYAAYGVAVANTAYGFRTQAFSYLQAYKSIAANAVTHGYNAGMFAFLFAVWATTRQNAAGFYANERAYIKALNTNAIANNIGANYNPAVSDVFGNSNGSITWS